MLLEFIRIHRIYLIFVNFPKFFHTPPSEGPVPRPIPSLRPDMIVSRVGRLVGRLHIHRHINRIHHYGTSSSSPPSKPISFQLIVPPTQEAQEVTFESADLLENMSVRELCVRWILQGNLSLSPPANMKISCHRTSTPSRRPIQSHWETWRITCTHVLKSLKKTRDTQWSITWRSKEWPSKNLIESLNRDGSRVVAEWEGIFEVDGRVFFLECKHKVTNVSTSLSHLC
jgi:hypothetical protein